MQARSAKSESFLLVLINSPPSLLLFTAKNSAAILLCNAAG